MCDITCKPWSLIQHFHNPSFLWKCEVFGFHFCTHVCRAAVETLSVFVHWNGVKSLYSKDQWKSTVEFLSQGRRFMEYWSFSWKTGWMETGSWWGGFADLLAWFCRDVAEQERRGKSDWSAGSRLNEPHEAWHLLNVCMTFCFLFVSSAGLPYGWEEAYTADGVKYYIKWEEPLPHLLIFRERL